MRNRPTRIVVTLFMLLAIVTGLSALNSIVSTSAGTRVKVMTTDETTIDWQGDARKLAAGEPIIRYPARSDISLPIREYPIKLTPKTRPDENWHERRNVTGGDTLKGDDPTRQQLAGPLTMPTPEANFEGQYNLDGYIPPDTNGDIGRNQYVQTVNSTFEVFARNGTSIYGPTNMNTIWTGFGGQCESNNDGDVIGLYDSMAGRWLISQFTTNTPSHQCIAISASEDAAGTYYRYDFVSGPTPGAFEDYPHFGVWPDAYYMTSNEFGGPYNGGNFAFERARMLEGDPTARMVFFGSSDGGLLPSDLDGALPPAGSPNYFVTYPDLSHLALYKFHVDWTTPSNSTFTGPTSLAVTPFTINRGGIPQLGTSVQVDPLNDRLMYRLAYRNFGDHEALALNYTIDTGSTVGPRWYELRDPNGTPTVYQEGTYSPADGIFRWMGSITFDHVGDMAIGFSASSSSIYPEIRYAGRLAGDPLGQMSQGEETLIAGGGSETNAAAPRWGDYSSISIDPLDDCTFWYTTEYFAQTGPRNWRTRIGSFKFPGCTGGTSTPVPTATGVYPTPTTPPPSPTPCTGYVSYTGVITNSDPTQTGRVNRGHPPSSCASPNSGSVTADGFVRHYDTYVYTNTTAVSQCVTIRVTNACSDNTTGSAAYLDTFNPASLAQNYLGDYGDIGGPQYSYSVNVPAGHAVVVVVHELSPNLGCESYTVEINPCTGGGGTPTTTPTPGTPTPTPACAMDYTVATGTATIVPGTNDIGNHTDDGMTFVSLPFPVQLYDQQFSGVNVSSNGNLQFVSTNDEYDNDCLASAAITDYAIFPFWDDQLTTPSGKGVFTSISGVEPNRIYNMEFRTCGYNTSTTCEPGTDTNYEIRLYEGQNKFDVIYGTMGLTGDDATLGVQRNPTQFTQYSCFTAISDGLLLSYSAPPCGTPTITPIPATSTATTPPATSTSPPATSTSTSPPATATSTSPPGATSTSPPGATSTSTSVAPTNTPGEVTATPTACTLEFTDVLPGSTFYDNIKCLACRGIINGYSSGCDTGNPCFKPANLVTRGQLAKIASNAAGFNDPTGPQQYEDVPLGSTFFEYIWQLTIRGYVNGYPCGGAGEPCGAGNLPYFRPNANITRGQISKIISNAAGLTAPAGSQQFQDVLPGSTFYEYIWRLTALGVMNGYACGGVGEPCVGPANLPYFRPGSNATRGQASKIVANTFLPGCQTPSR